MYLIDTNVLSEIRKKDNANYGVKEFFRRAVEQDISLFISVVTIGEIRRGVSMIRHRGNNQQANNLKKWLEIILDEYSENILDFTATEAQVWGELRVPNHENALDKQITATACS